MSRSYSSKKTDREDRRWGTQASFFMHEQLSKIMEEEDKKFKSTIVDEALSDYIKKKAAEKNRA